MLIGEPLVNSYGMVSYSEIFVGLRESISDQSLRYFACPKEVTLEVIIDSILARENSKLINVNFAQRVTDEEEYLDINFNLSWIGRIAATFPLIHAARCIMPRRS